ncbi:MAG: ChrR family anti-sigma-E factor [Tateyamaria sp.]|uniref:ChrR family anti-sigma-E factor n=1 Tax=Tateyamaria sp. TaxID=1929288 RepID=UPI00328C419A
MEQTIKHHLTDDILMGYAAGNLPEAFNLMVATHLSLCDACRAQAESYDALGGALFSQSDLENVALTPGSFAATMAMIADGPAELPPTRRAAGSIFPSPLQDYVGGDLDCVKWRSIGMGVKQAILPTTRDASARLLFIPAGAAMPDHGHNGTEMTLVLQGAFQDEDEYFARGDVETADSDLHHTPVADIHADCICLAVTDAPLQFEGLIHKIAQRFARI